MRSRIVAFFALGAASLVVAAMFTGKMSLDAAGIVMAITGILVYLT